MISMLLSLNLKRPHNSLCDYRVCPLLTVNGPREQHPYGALREWRERERSGEAYGKLHQILIKHNDVWGLLCARASPVKDMGRSGELDPHIKIMRRGQMNAWSSNGEDIPLSAAGSSQEYTTAVSSGENSPNSSFSFPFHSSTVSFNEASSSG